jgi:hypothetical protein
MTFQLKLKRQALSRLWAMTRRLSLSRLGGSCQENEPVGAGERRRTPSRSTANAWGTGGGAPWEHAPAVGSAGHPSGRSQRPEVAYEKTPARAVQFLQDGAVLFRGLTPAYRPLTSNQAELAWRQEAIGHRTSDTPTRRSAAKPLCHWLASSRAAANVRPLHGALSPRGLSKGATDNRSRGFRLPLDYPRYSRRV